MVTTNLSMYDTILLKAKNINTVDNDDSGDADVEQFEKLQNFIEEDSYEMAIELFNNYNNMNKNKKIQKLNINRPFKNTIIPLHLSVECKNERFTNLFLSKCDANPNILNGKGDTPINTIIRGFNDNEPLVCNLLINLLNYGADVNHIDFLECSPIESAFTYNKFNFFEILLKYNVNYISQRYNNHTLIEIAISHEKLKIIDILLANFADFRRHSNEIINKNILNITIDRRNPIILLKLLNYNVEFNYLDRIVQSLFAIDNILPIHNNNASIISQLCYHLIVRKPNCLEELCAMPEYASIFIYLNQLRQMKKMLVTKQLTYYQLLTNDIIKTVDDIKKFDIEKIFLNIKEIIYDKFPLFSKQLIAKFDAIYYRRKIFINIYSILSTKYLIYTDIKLPRNILTIIVKLLSPFSEVEKFIYEFK